MNPKHKRTLAALMGSPTPKSLPFRNVESLLAALGCEVAEGEGSRVSFNLKGRSMTLHRPHPGKDIQSYQIRDVKGFLKKAGVQP